MTYVLKTKSMKRFQDLKKQHCAIRKKKLDKDLSPKTKTDGVLDPLVTMFLMANLWTFGIAYWIGKF